MLTIDDEIQPNQSLKIYRDYKNTLDASFDEGKIEGKIEGKLEEKIEIVKQMKKLDITIEVISQVTGLSEDEISRI